MSDPLLDIRIGTMIKANQPDPVSYVRQILPLGFESFQPFFWQIEVDDSALNSLLYVADIAGTPACR